MTYGYEPPKHQDQGSWGEIFEMTKAVFIALFIPLSMIGLAILLLLLTIMALFSNPILALLPLGALGAGGYYMVRRDRKAHADLDDEIHNAPPYRTSREMGPPRPPR